MAVEILPFRNYMHRKGVEHLKKGVTIRIKQSILSLERTAGLHTRVIYLKPVVLSGLQRRSFQQVARMPIWGYSLADSSVLYWLHKLE